MREASCSVFSVLEHGCIAQGRSVRELVKGLPISIEQLRDPSEWMDWDVYMELCDRFGRMTSMEGCVQAGRDSIDLEVAKPMRHVGGVVLSLKQLYRIAFTWRMQLVNRGVSVRIKDIGHRRLEVSVSLPASYPHSEAWFRIVQGALEMLPTASGCPSAAVDVAIMPRQAVYSIQLPEKKASLLAVFRSLFAGRVLAEVNRQINEMRRLEVERARVDDALRERERTLSNLIANLSGMVYRCRKDPERTCEFVSDGCLDLTGYRADELVENRVLPFSALIHEDDADLVRQRRRASLAAHQPSSNEYRLRTRSGELRWVLDVVQGLYDEQGNLIGSEGFIADVTASKRLEEELSHARRMESIGQLAGGVAHDFNNLLTVILGHTELAALGLREDDPRRQSIEQVHAAATRAAGLTKQLLAFARKQVMEPRVIDLNELIVRVDSLLRRALGEHIDVATVPASDLWKVEVDPGQFEHVLLNLAVNARDAMPEGGRLTMETANVVIDEPLAHLPGLASGPYVRMSVSDTGIGMSREVQKRAFEPFFTTKEVGKGTGLGLASAHGIVQQARGHMYIWSTEGRGTRFDIFLPRSGSDASDSPFTSRSEPPPPRAAHETVLVVEDHDMLRDMVVQTLRAQGYEVLAARGGAEALELAAQHPGAIHLLLTDVVMPHMTGPQLAHRLLESLPDVPVLYVSGYSEQSLLRELEAGTNASFFAKPFTPVDLSTKVREVLRASARRDKAKRAPSSNKREPLQGHIAR